MGLRIKGTAFAERTARNMVAAQAAPIPPQGDVTLMFAPPMGTTQNSFGVGLAAGKAPNLGIAEVLNGDRVIRNDPREAFFWTLPNKLTPQQCLQMLRAALAGDLFQQFNLCQLMLDTWPTFRMAAHQLQESAAYLRYAVHPFAEEGKKPTPRAQERADLVSRAMRAMSPNPFNDEKGFSGMAYVLCDAMLNGLSLVELLWEQRAGSDTGREWLPVSSAWVHPRHYTFSTAGNIALYTDDAARINSGLLEHRPGGIPDPDKFLCAQFISKAGTSLGAGFMRPLVWYWAARQFNNEWMLNTAKQYGSPFIDITYKPGTVSTGPGGELEKLNEMLKTAGPQRRLLHPEGTLATIHPPTSLGKENPQRVLEEKADEACLFLLLGQKGTTTAVSGQLGNDDSHENVKEERKLGLANWLARNPLRQFARAVLRRNYGEDSECPEITPDTTKPLKTEQVGQLATAISGSRIPIRADEFYKKIGFTQPEEGETVLAAGVISVQGAALTDEEKFNQDLQKQVAQGEAQIGLQMEAQAGQADSGSAKAFDRSDIGVIKAATGAYAPGHEFHGNQWRTNDSGVAAGHNEAVNSGFKANEASRAAIASGSKPDHEKAKALHKEAHAAFARMWEHAKRHGELAAADSYRKAQDNHWSAHVAHHRVALTAKGSEVSLRDALVHATDAELAELEAKLTAAEGAAHLNGEAAELEATVAGLEGRRW